MWTSSAAVLLVLAAAPPIAVTPGTPARPETAAAQVLLLSGESVLAAKSGDVKLATGMLLEAGDRVRVPENAWLTLFLLGNGRVVRLDDDVAMRVDELAVFKAPAVGVDLEQQLNQLLSTSERKANDQRLMGWKAGMSGASAPKPTIGGKGGGGATAKKLDVDDALMPSPEPPRAPAPGSPPPPPPPPPPADEAAPKRRMKAEEPQAKEKSRGLDESAKKPTPPMKQARVLGLRADPELQGCLATAYAAVDLLPTTKTVVLEVKLAGEEVSLRLPQGFPPPACARAWAEGHRAQLSPSWTAVEVVLTK